MYYILKVFAFIFSKMPIYLLDALARFLAFVGFDLLRIRRRQILSNIDTAFGQSKSKSEKRRVARECYYHFLLTVIEFTRGYYIDFAQNVVIEGSEHLHRALDQGRGAYVLCIHMGNWEMMGAATSRRICPSHVIVKVVGSKSIDRFVEEVRKKNGFFSIKRDKGSTPARETLRIIKKNEIVGFVMDQSRPGEPRIPFFGKPAKTNTGLAVLAARTQAPIIPGYAKRLSFGKHLIIFKEALPQFSQGDGFDAIQTTGEFNRVIEKMIMENPEQFLWLHNRWK